MVEERGYWFGVEYGELVNKVLDKIKRCAVKGNPIFFESNIDPDIYIYDSPGTTMGALIFTTKEEKVNKVKELEKDLKKLEKIDFKLEELFEKEGVEEILEKYGVEI